MPDTFRAGDLREHHYGRRIRWRTGEGVLRGLVQIDDTHVQLLVLNGGAGAPLIPSLGQGEPIEFVDEPPEPVDSPPV